MVKTEKIKPGTNRRSYVRNKYRGKYENHL